MAYPVEILPKEHYPRQMDFRKILENNGVFHVCRRIDRPLKDYIMENPGGNLKELDPDCLGEHIVNLSLNLLGADFKEEHLIFRTLGDGSRNWSGQPVGDSLEGRYEILPDGYPLYYSSADLHRKTYEYPIKVGKKEKGKYNAMRDTVKSLCLSAFSGMETTVDFPLEIFIAHSPTNLNYWHVEMKVKPALEDDDKSFKNAGSYRKDIYAHILTEILCKKFIERLETIQQLPLCSYCSLSRHCR